MASEAKLIVTIQNVNPIEITDFSDSFLALGAEYYKFLAESTNYKLSKDTKLYVVEVKTGSIVTVLTDLVAPALPLIEYTNSIIEYSKFLKAAFNYFLGTGDKPKTFDITDCNNFNNIIKPIAKDNGSQVIFTGDINVETLNINFSYNSLESNAIQNGIIKEKWLIKEPSMIVHEKVLFYWDSAKYDDKSKSIDKGLIDSLNASPLKVVFDSPETKKVMLDTQNNPFHIIYVVDVEIMKVQGLPVAYKIIALHESFSK
jgi:hypothetical protein